VAPSGNPDGSRDMSYCPNVLPRQCVLTTGTEAVYYSFTQFVREKREAQVLGGVYYTSILGDTLKQSQHFFFLRSLPRSSPPILPSSAPICPCVYPCACTPHLTCPTLPSSLPLPFNPHLSLANHHLIVTAFSPVDCH